MKKILFMITMFITLCNASSTNPKVYSALGDVIYNNAPKIKKLKDIKIYKNQINKIDSYLQDVDDLKRKGFMIENGDQIISNKKYLSGLRELSKLNDFYKRSARDSFRNAVKNNDSKTFEKIINTGLINTKRNKEKIINYYFAHQTDINSSGVIQGYLDADAKLRSKRESKRKYYKTRKQLQEEKIRRIRKNDKEAQAKLEKKLDAEVLKKKEEIIQEQKSELFH